MNETLRVYHMPTLTKSNIEKLSRSVLAAYLKRLEAPPERIDPIDFSARMCGLHFETADLSKMTDVLGHSVRERLNTLIHDVIQNSMNRPSIIMSTDMEKAMKALRVYMFENLYLNSIPKREDRKAKELLIRLFHHYMDKPEELPAEYLQLMEQRGDSEERVVCDYIAGMSDGYAISLFEELYVPRSWK